MKSPYVTDIVSELEWYKGVFTQVDEIIDLWCDVQQKVSHDSLLESNWNGFSLNFYLFNELGKA